LNNDFFSNSEEIPINDFPAVIANGRHLDEWGWTDMISTASQNVPLQIMIDTSHEIGQGFDEIITVYTDDDPIIYFLDRLDVFDGLEIVGSTIYDDEDVVVAVARAGSILTKPGFPDTIINANTCFFGVTESADWTEDSIELFKSCIDFVAVDCMDDSFCQDEISGDPFCFDGDVYQNLLDFHCENPGTPFSMCVDDVIPILIEDCEDFSESCIEGECVDVVVICNTDSDCGSDFFGDEEICQNDDVFDSFTSFSCVNGGTEDAFCTSSVELILREDCFNFCDGGICVECAQDDHCPIDLSLSDPFCTDNVVFQDILDNSCVNNQCVSEVGSEILDICEANEICTDGECGGISCFNNLDCGENGFGGGLFCSDLFGDVNENFVSYVCNSPGTVDSSCSSYNLPIIVEFCESACFDGECAEIGCMNDLDCDDDDEMTEDNCVNQGTPESFCIYGGIECFVDNDCGVDNFMGGLFCSNDIVSQNFESFTCANGGEVDSFCFSEVLIASIDICEDFCFDGECAEFECSEDSECDDNDSSTEDICVFAGTEISFCENVEEPICEDVCINGATQCSGNGYQFCGDFTGDGCTDWSGVFGCGFGGECLEGICVYQ